MLTKTRNHQAGSVHIVLIVGAVLLLVAAVGWFTYNKLQYTQKVNKERALYAAVDKEAKAYIDAVAEKYPGEITHNNECSYTSEIYSKGFLGCSVNSKIDIVLADDSVSEKEILQFTDKLQKTLPWDFKETSVDNTYTSPNNIKISTYNLQDKTCAIQYGYKEEYLGSMKYKLILKDGNKVLEVQAGCDGSALAEYYK